MSVVSHVFGVSICKNYIAMTCHMYQWIIEKLDTTGIYYTIFWINIGTPTY